MEQRTSLLEAIGANDVARVRHLLEKDPALAGTRTAEGVSALLLALYHRNADASAALQAAISRLDVFEAAAVGDVACLERGLDEEPALAAARAGDGFTALHLACYFGQVEAAAALLARGADVGAAADNASRVRPLHSAIAARTDPGRRDALVALLLEAKADVDAVQAGGWTPLMAAAKTGARGLVRRLLAAGADPEKKADDGQSARGLAAAEARDLLE